jgi:hypothetical protein
MSLSNSFVWNVILLASIASVVGCADLTPTDPGAELEADGAATLLPEGPQMVRRNQDGSIDNYQLPSSLTLQTLADGGGLAPSGFTIDETEVQAFSGYEPEEDTTGFPQRMAVRLVIPGTEEEPDPGFCSGILVDDTLVLTAAHCVHTGGPQGEWRPFARVTPAAQGPSLSAGAPFGYAWSTTYSIPQTWIDTRHQDLALIVIDRPVGFLTGWANYLAPTCNSLQTITHTSHRSLPKRPTTARCRPIPAHSSRAPTKTWPRRLPRSSRARAAGASIA